MLYVSHCPLGIAYVNLLLIICHSHLLCATHYSLHVGFSCAVKRSTELETIKEMKSCQHQSLATKSMILFTYVYMLIRAWVTNQQTSYPVMLWVAQFIL